MMILESIRIALSQLWSNKMRSALTLLGMLIGVGSVVGIVSISEGMRRFIVDEFGKMGGDNLIIIIPETRVMKDGRWVEATHYQPMSLADIEAVENVSDRIDAALPILEADVEVRFEKTVSQGKLNSTLPSYMRGFNWQVESGRFLQDRDVDKRYSVCVIGTKVQQEVFKNRNPLGREVKINGRRYTVVGVMEERALFGDDWGNRIMVPVTTAQQRFFGHKYIHAIIAFTHEPEDGAVVVPEIRKALKRQYGRKSEFRIDTGKGILAQVEQTILVMKLVTGGIAGISLLVGGIGIMNIMLVSVTERIREIGVRKALGAKNFTLMVQFIVESIVLSLAGGILGIALGVGLGLGIAFAIERYAEMPFPSVVSYSSVLLALGISTAIGLFFGIYPAMRAARLDPVTALGAE